MLESKTIVRIRLAMVKKSYNQKQLAEKAGVTESAMSRYLRGEREPHLSVLKRIANALSVSVGWLAGEEERPSAKWVWVSSTYDRVPCHMRYMCSNCRQEVMTHGQEPWEHYCPNCGAKMSVK